MAAAHAEPPAERTTVTAGTTPANLPTIMRKQYAVEKLQMSHDTFPTRAKADKAGV